MNKTAIFVDVQNIYYTTRQVHNCNFDYTAFWTKATAKREVIGAYAYAIERNDDSQKRFQSILRGIGFKVKLKPFIQRSDGTSKGDWDVGITIDIMELASEADIIVLASGDGDFSLLADKVRLDMKKVFEVYGVKSLTADTLKEAASRYIPIENDLLLKS